MSPVRSDPVHRAHIVILDYDDTLSPTSCLKTVDADLTAHRTALDRLERAVVSLLSGALHRTIAVHIITNAERAWVDLSVKKWLPSVPQFFNRVHIVSARDEYDYLGDMPTVWKAHAIHKILSGYLERGMHLNVVSIGDSHCEREATKHVLSTQPQSLCKTFKMMELPTVREMTLQLEALVKVWDRVVFHNTDLDVEMIVPRDGENEDDEYTPVCQVSANCTLI